MPFWRSCWICGADVDGHNHYYFHVTDEHKTVIATKEVRQHYANEVARAIFEIGAQPRE